MGKDWYFLSIIWLVIAFLHTYFQQPVEWYVYVASSLLLSVEYFWKAREKHNV